MGCNYPRQADHVRNAHYALCWHVCLQVGTAYRSMRTLLNMPISDTREVIPTGRSPSITQTELLSIWHLQRACTSLVQDVQHSVLANALDTHHL